MLDLFESAQHDHKVVEAMRTFLSMAAEELALRRLPNIVWVTEPRVTEKTQSFGKYANEDKAIRVVIRNRHPLDVMRTLAHELVHYKQDTEGRIRPDSGATGSPIENEANAMAGRIMRRFGREHPDAFLLVMPGR
jgi:Zn-dependent peptidase ImmA (M78 family)